MVLLTNKILLSRFVLLDFEVYHNKFHEIYLQVGEHGKVNLGAYSGEQDEQIEHHHHEPVFKVAILFQVDP
jgi:hypothetical protein